ncbi:phosphorylase family protein [Pseudomonas sp. Hz4]
MIKLLIVDDEYVKISAISEVVTALDDSIQIEHASTSSEARRKLRQTEYDLLIIDLNLPAAIGASPTRNGGLEFFDILLLDKDILLPDVIFLSALEDSLEEAEKAVNERGAIFCSFSTGDSGIWKQILSGKVKYASQRRARINAASPRFDVVIMTALGEPELTAVLKLNYGWKALRFSNDPTGYHVGEIPRANGSLSVVAASARRKGMPSSASLASKMVARFQPRYVVMLGICAGVKDKTNYGDVIVADPSWDWGSGKHAEKEDGTRVFMAAPYPHPLDTHISQLAMEIGTDKVARELQAGWEGGLPEGKLSIRVGPMASGAAVLATNDAMQPITAQNREVLAVEMEAYAVMASADFACKPSPIPIAIKSVCDFADAEKNDLWQGYAAYTSAAFFNRLFTDEHLM